MKLALRLTSFCSLFLAASVLAQQQFPTLERGLQPDKLYHFAGIDNVNVFNGNLAIVLPIGMSYPVDGGLSYQLTLSYNSNLWDWERFSAIDGSEARAAIPARKSNAGTGWILGFGNFIPRTDPDNNSFADVYQGADGADHRFEKSTDAEPNVKYTADGSNLRLRTNPPLPPPLVPIPTTEAWIDFPDGTVQYWKQNSAKHWELLEIDAPRGSTKVTFAKLGSRPTQCAAGTNSWWNITDGIRNHYVCYKDYNNDFQTKPMVDSIVFDGPQNQASIYRFTYATIDVFLPRGEYMPKSPAEQVRRSHKVLVLKSITLPDQSSFKFEHAPDRTAPIAGLYPDPNLLSVTLPTGGRIEYEYRVPPQNLWVIELESSRP